MKVAIKQLVANYYEFREPVSALLLRDIPHHFETLLANEKIYDYSPTPG
ncbi:MAG TPA: hypothetical protein VKT80_17730 [Chloroflexota bacterium]|nr:hypothetical protein [Chloroflexota bacterium]